MLKRNNYHEIAKIVGREIVPAHTEMAYPSALSVLAETNSILPMIQEDYPTECILHLRGKHNSFAWRVDFFKARDLLSRLNEGDEVDVAYQNNFFGLLEPTILSITPLNLKR